MRYLVSQNLENGQVETACRLVEKFTREDAFWQLLAEKFYNSGVTDDLIRHEVDIRKHLKFMFTEANCVVAVKTYTTKNPFSSVLGHAEDATVFENTRKLNSLTLAQRTGHIGHETCHLFGYSHAIQGDRLSATVRFGEVLEIYAEKRIKELGIK